jgi:putative sugar O-methyltransferase
MAARRTARANHPLVGYYVEKYVRPDYGTSAQLRRGLRRRPVTSRAAPDILTRLTRAWQAMKKEAPFVSDPYRVGGEWAPIIAHAFGPLVKALDADDRRSLHALLAGFFRHFGDYVGEPTDATSAPIQRYRRDLFRVWASRWIDLYREDSLADATTPSVGAPVGFVLNDRFFTFATFVNNFYARRMEDLAAGLPTPVVCEIGGGCGGFAYHLLRRRQPRFKYVDYDIPVMSIVAAYSLIATLPDVRVGLFGEVDDIRDPLRNCDAAILPNFVLPQLAPQYADVCFNACSFAEMDKSTVEEYMRQIERVCRGYVLHVNHSWTAGSKNACYEPLGGFRHWDVSSVEPSTTIFKRLHKIPAPFFSDFYGEFFEWLYARPAHAAAPEGPAFLR